MIVKYSPIFFRSSTYDGALAVDVRDLHLEHLLLLLGAHVVDDGDPQQLGRLPRPEADSEGAPHIVLPLHRGLVPGAAREEDLSVAISNDY